MTIDNVPVEDKQENTDTYRDPDLLYSIASWAERLAIPVAVILVIATLGQSGIQLYAILKSGGSGEGLTINLGYAIFGLLRDLGIATVSYFALRGLAQGLFMLMDLDEKKA
jgi:hypothetical protein